MVCPKCRKSFPDDVKICPDCNTELIAVLGSADAKSEGEMQKIIIENTNGSPTVIYKTVPEENRESGLAGAFALLALGVLLIAAGLFCIIKGVDYTPVQSCVSFFSLLT